MKTNLVELSKVWKINLEIEKRDDQVLSNDTKMNSLGYDLLDVQRRTREQELAMAQVGDELIMLMMCSHICILVGPLGNSSL